MLKLLLGVLCLVGVGPPRVGGEVFTAVATLRELVSNQHRLLDNIEEYVQREESRLKEIRRYVLTDWLLTPVKVKHTRAEHDYNKWHRKTRSQVERTIGILKQRWRLVNAKRDEPKQAATELAALRHPLSAYYLVRDWSFLSDQIFDASALEEFQAKMPILPAPIPNAEDRHGALQSLLRLQLTYNLSIEELSEGSVRGYKAPRPLDGRDMFDLGVAALNGKLNLTAVKWLTKALETPSHEVQKSDLYFQIGKAYNRTADFDKAKKYVDLAHILDTKNTTLKNAARIMASIAAKNDSGEGDECRDDSLAYRRGYEAICSRGMTWKRSFLTSNVWCAYHTHTVPYLTYKMEVLSADPWIVMYYDVITNTEVENVKKLAIPHLQRATIGYPSGQKGSLTRISKSAWLFERNGRQPVTNIALRVQDITGLETTMRTNFTSAEALQVVNYGIGGQFEPHFDFYQRQDALDKLKGYLAGTGDRIATFMFYLSDVEEGGATVFPFLNLYLAPVKNGAAFWYNFHRNGTMDTRVGHAGCPVLIGEKWVANKWIRQRAQLFRHQCGPKSTSTEAESRAALLK